MPEFITPLPLAVSFSFHLSGSVWQTHCNNACTTHVIFPIHTNWLRWTAVWSTSVFTARHANTISGLSFYNPACLHGVVIQSVLHVTSLYKKRCAVGKFSQCYIYDRKTVLFHTEAHRVLGDLTIKKFLASMFIISWCQRWPSTSKVDYQHLCLAQSASPLPLTSPVHPPSCDKSPWKQCRCISWSRVEVKRRDWFMYYDFVKKDNAQLIWWLSKSYDFEEAKAANKQ